MSNKTNIRLQFNYWTWWRVTMEVIRFVVFIVMEIFIFLIIYIEIMYFLRGSGLGFSLPFHTGMAF